MTNKNAAQQASINRAKSRALERLRKQHSEDYEKYYEEEMRVEGYGRTSSDTPVTWRTCVELVDVESDLPPGTYDGVVVGADAKIEDDHGVMTLKMRPISQPECTGANDGTCPKHPEITNDALITRYT